MFELQVYMVICASSKFLKGINEIMRKKTTETLMDMTATVLRCDNCNPTDELDKLNPRRSTMEEMKEYRKNFVGIYITGNAPADYNDKLEQLICPFCGHKLIDTKFPHDDYYLIGEVTDWNRQVLDIMMELYEKDPTEYQLKRKQFIQQQEELEWIREQERKSYLPHCPTCGSTDIKKISGTERAMSIIALGIFSNKINKSYKCLNCKCTW